MADELRLSIEKMIYGGDGLAHADGNTVFVPYVLPSEQVRASVRTQKKKLIHANLLEVEKAAPSRIEPACPHFSVCGGCHYQHIEIAEQVRLKKEILRETLSRLGGVQWTGAIREHTAQPYGYRNRAQWAFRDAMPRSFGYFLPESAHILPIDKCPVLSPRLAATFAQLQELARANSLPPGILEIEAFADGEDEKIALNIAFERFPVPPKSLAGAFKAALPTLETLLLLDQSRNRFALEGSGYLLQKAGSFTYRVNHLSFFQVNRFLIEDLLQTMVGGAKGGYALDLYAGVGFFTLPLSKAFSKVVGVDANLAATRDLRHNAETAGLAVISENQHTEEFLKKDQEKPDFVILDPPRAGLGAEAAARLGNLGAPDIAYLSCDPSTLARDLSVLTGSERKHDTGISPTHKYEIAEMHLFDLFPQTFHIETLVRLRRVS
jgi:23S rRNA (uracil1939-C5)-methyltransferase